MTHMTIREALLAMGYQEKIPGHWLKPIGYQCFSYHEGKGMWANMFRSMSGAVCCYTTSNLSRDIDHFGSYLKQLKDLECFTRTDMYVDGKSEFQLEAFDI
jgi:hypothetical protein